MDISDFNILRHLGEGSYSDVYLARFEPDEAFPGLVSRGAGPVAHQLFALKIIDKHFALKHSIVDQVYLERRLHEELNDESCVAGLSFTFKDDTNLYFGLEPCLYGELFDAIEAKLEVAEVKFYAAQIVVMLDALRRHEVIHRDLKPENILLGANGHLKLIDFGSALWIADVDEEAKRKLAKKRGMLVGTAEYVAPEVLQHLDGTGVDYGVDLWSLGVILYQMMTGVTPFRGASEYLTFQNILKNAPDLSRLPHVDTSDKDGGDDKEGKIDKGGEEEERRDSARDLIERLLRSNPSERIGVSSMDELREHPFFSDVDWDTLYDEDTPTPYFLRRKFGDADILGGCTDEDETWELQGLQSLVHTMNKHSLN